MESYPHGLSTSQNVSNSIEVSPTKQNSIVRKRSMQMIVMDNESESSVVIKLDNTNHTTPRESANGVQHINGSTYILD